MGKIIILDGTCTAGKTSIGRKLKNCHHLSWDKTVWNLFAGVVERKIAKLDKAIVDKMVEHGIVDVEKTLDGNVEYKLPRNNIELLLERMILFKTKIMSQSNMVLGHKRTTYDAKYKKSNKVEQEEDSQQAPIELITEAEKKECFKKIDQTMLEEAVRLVKQDKNVVIDTVIGDSSTMKKFKKFFSKYETCFVLLYCSIKDLVTRVRRRNEKARKEGTSDLEERKLSQPLCQFLNMYRVADDVSKNKLLGVLSNPQDSIISREIIDFAFKSGSDLFDESCDSEKIKQDMTEKFGLEDKEFVRIEPQLPYDLIIDNGENGSLEGCVQKIQALLN